MIGEKAADMIKEDWAEAEEAAHTFVKCTSESVLSNDEMISTVNNKLRNAGETQSSLDIFTEISNLFPSLQNDLVSKDRKLNNNNRSQNLNTVPVKSEERKESFPLNRIHNPKSNSFRINNMYNPDLSFYDHNSNNPNTFLKPYPYFISGQGTEDLNFRVSQSTLNGKNRFHNPANPNLKVDNELIHSDITHDKKPKIQENQSHHERFSQNHKKCRTWLYHNGMNYEVEF